MKLARIVGYCILAVSLVYFVGAGWRYVGSLAQIPWTFASVAILAGSILLYLMQFLTAGIAWHLWLRAVREPSRPGMAIALFSFSQFAKYVPGSIAHHIARVALGKRHGLGTVGMVVSIALETTWAILTGVAVAVIALTFIAPPMTGIDLPSPLQIALVVLVAVLVPLVGLWLVGERRPAFMDRLLGDNRIAHPGLGTLAACFLIYALNMAISGYNLDFLARALFDAPPGHGLQAIGIFSIAWVMAVLALVAPGGVGVREAVLLAGLTPAYGAGTALGVAVVYRVVTLLGDAAGCVLGFLAEQRLSRRTAL